MTRPPRTLAVQWACLAATALVATLCAAPAHAQDDKRLAQVREALRRAQQSLQSTQAERDALQQDKTKLEQQKQRAEQALATAAARQKEAEGGRTRLSGSLAALQAERDRLQADLERERAEGGKLRTMLEDTQGKLVQAEGLAADQRRTTLALRGLLERSVQSLADNERQNRTLYELGTRAVADYQQCQEHGSSSPDGNLLGLGTVRTTSVAEALRREMDAVAAPATLAPPARAAAP